MKNDPKYHQEYRRKNRDKINQQKREFYQANRERLITEQKKRRKNNPLRYTQTYLKKQCKERAKTQGVPCTISIDDIIIPEMCPILPWIKITPNHGQNHATAASPTVDKIIPELGYVPGNIQVISHRANVLKSNASVKELKALSHWINTCLYG